MSATEINPEHLADGLPEGLQRLESAGYPVDIEEVHVIPSSSSEYAYLVATIDTLRLPTEEADVVEDSCRVKICHCPDFTYRQMPEVEEGEIVADIGSCKHTERVR